MTIYLEDSREIIGETQIAPERRRVSGALYGSLVWAWDTQGLAPGPYKLQFRTPPDRFQWHEAAYLESAALVEYLIRTYGQDQFTKFYRGIRPANSYQAGLEAGLNDFFNTSLA